MTKLEDFLNEQIAELEGVDPEQVTPEFIRGMRHARESSVFGNVNSKEVAQQVLARIANGENVCSCGTHQGAT